MTVLTITKRPQGKIKLNNCLKYLAEGRISLDYSPRVFSDP